jgi:hypothetical protein
MDKCMDKWIDYVLNELMAYEWMDLLDGKIHTCIGK